MKFFLPFFFILFISCKSPVDYKKEVFMGLQLGSTAKQYNQQLKGLIDTKQVFVYKTYSDEINYCHRKLGLMDYYTAFIYKVPEADSLIESITVIYCNEVIPFRFPINDIEMHISRLESGSSSNSLFINNKDFVKAEILKDSVISQISQVYGKYDKYEYNTKNIIGFEQTYKWLDKNGIDLTLNFWNGQNSYATGDACLWLKYAYTDEIHKKVFKRINSY